MLTRCSQWRYQDGHDREMMEKATRKFTDEDKEMMDRPIEGRNGELRKIEVCQTSTGTREQC